MSFLQRGIIDVNANVYCGTPSQAVRETTERFLAASTGRRPYVGAVIRHCITPETLATLLANEEDQLKGSIPPELAPVNQALQSWWSTQPQVEEFAVQDLGFTTRIGYEQQKHYDQSIGEDGTPDWGPLTGLITLHGVTKYYLSVLRESPFGQERWKYNSKLMFRESDSFPTGKPTVTTSTGDLLLITNVPPTCHATRFDDGRIGAVFFSRFTRLEPTVSGVE